MICLCLMESTPCWTRFLVIRVLLFHSLEKEQLTSKTFRLSQYQQFDQRSLNLDKTTGFVLIKWTKQTCLYLIEGKTHWTRLLVFKVSFIVPWKRSHCFKNFRPYIENWVNQLPLKYGPSHWLSPSFVLIKWTKQICLYLLERNVCWTRLLGIKVLLFRSLKKAPLT